MAGPFICFNCRTEYRVVKNGVPVIFRHAINGKPALIRYGDLFECPGCHNQIIPQMGNGIYDHHECFVDDLEAAYKQKHLEVFDQPNPLLEDYVEAQARQEHDEHERNHTYFGGERD